MIVRSPLNIGIIGAGRVSQLVHINSFVATEGCNLVALADHHIDRAKLTAAKHGIERVYGSHKNLLQDPEIEAVVVVTNRRDTAPIVKDALEAGCHVLSEKPMAFSLADATELVRTAERRALIYNVGYMKRFEAAVSIAKDIIDGSDSRHALGQLVSARFYCHGGRHSDSEPHFESKKPRRQQERPIAEPPKWLPRTQLDAYDEFLNMYSHDLNLARYLLGGRIVIEETDEVDGVTSLISANANGIPVRFEFGDFPHASWHEGADILFSNGVLNLSLPWFLDASGRATLHVSEASDMARSEKYQGSNWAFREQASSFVSNVVGGTRQVCGGGDCLDDYRLIEDIFRR